MASAANSKVKNNKNDTPDTSFVVQSDEELAKLLEESKAKNTNRSTDTSMRRLRAYLAFMKMDSPEDLPYVDLPKAIEGFYTSVRTKKNGELYQTGSFKVLRAGLNRWFKAHREIDIVADPNFNHANTMFDSVQSKAKKIGKGVVKSTQVISEDDLQLVSQYFLQDHVTRPNPKVLQQCVLFYIMYFFCRRGQENLYEMTKKHFDLGVEPDGTRFIYQAIDEKDKNHNFKDTTPTNQVRMYEDTGNNVTNNKKSKYI